MIGVSVNMAIYDTDDIVQDCSNSIANALEFLQSGTKLLIYGCMSLVPKQHHFTEQGSAICLVLNIKYSSIQRFTIQSVENLHASSHSPDNKVHGAIMGPTWVLSAPDGPHVDPMNLAIRELDQVFAMTELSVVSNGCSIYMGSCY